TPSGAAGAAAWMAAQLVAVEHLPSTQPKRAQSAGALHVLPLAQPAHAPPQSTSVSEPFRTPSVQVSVHLPPAHTPDAQSPGAAPAFRSAHLGHAPPQSTSASLPCLTPSLQLASTHPSALHTPEPQSLPSLQLRLPPHLPQVGPPQSTSV